MRFGVHLSIGKGFEGTITQAETLGLDTFQIFAGNPRGWARKPMSASEFEPFRVRLDKTTIHPVVVHAAYLPNPATEDDTLYQKSIINLTEDFHRANKLGAGFFVLHPGRSNDHDSGISRVAQTVKYILENIDGPTVLLLENQAGGKNDIAANFNDLNSILTMIGIPERTGICFDTCHAFASGYDLSHELGWKRTLAEVEKEVGLSRIKLFHLNDSKGSMGSGLDRHEHIGEGQIGTSGFHYLFHHKELRKLPGILETPQNDPGDDIKNLTMVRQLADS